MTFEEGKSKLINQGYPNEIAVILAADASGESIDDVVWFDEDGNPTSAEYVGLEERPRSQ